MTSTDQPLEMASASVADVALAFPQAVNILTKYDLDFCCNGKVPFTEACKDQTWIASAFGKKYSRYRPIEEEMN